MSWLWLVEKACGGHHTHHTTELVLGHACNLGDILEGRAAAQGDAGQHLELAQPLQTREQLILLAVRFSYNSGCQAAKRNTCG